MSGPWTREEVEATVADYLHMLTQELAGQSYNKTEHRRALQRKLDNRPEGAIERKHQNISAILLELGCPWISGYKPLSNYQRLLFEVVEEQVATNPLFDQVALRAADQPAILPLLSDFKEVLVSSPTVRHRAKDRQVPYGLREKGFKRDYLMREARNASLGRAGEEFVAAYERARLHALGKKDLSDRVEHVTETKGDGLGFDVWSFEETGRDRFIEVKTTAFAKETPFFISRNEVEFSKSFAKQFQLYRLFEFRKLPRMFSLTGAITDNCILDPVTYVGRFS
jgi:hypothetical protein